MPNTVLLVRSILTKALSDEQFFTQLPEFKSLQAKLKTMQAPAANHGCSGCRQRRIEQNLFNDFLLVVWSLSPEAVIRFKKYLGADQLMYSAHNPQTGGYETRVV